MKKSKFLSFPNLKPFVKQTQTYVRQSIKNYSNQYECVFQRIAGSNSELQTIFTDALGSMTPYTEMKVTEAINTLNTKRKEKLLLLLEYIEDQG